MSTHAEHRYERLYLDVCRCAPIDAAAQDRVFKLVQFAFQERNTDIDDFETATNRIRRRLLALLGDPSGGIILGPSVSYLSSQASRWWSPSDRQTVVCLEAEHPSAWLPWVQAGFELRQARLNCTRDATDALAATIDKSTAVVVASQCHWHNGARIDLERIAHHSSRMGARLVVDASQSLGVIDNCWEAINADLIVFSAQKWLFGAPGLACAFVPERNLHHPPLDVRPSGFIERLEELSVVSMTPDFTPSRLDSACINRSLAVFVLDAGLDEHQYKPRHYWERRHLAWQSALLEEIGRSGNALSLAHRESPHITAFRIPESGVAHAKAALLQSSIVATVRAGWIRISPDLRFGAPDPRRVAESIRIATGHH